ncbi:hypothetical protein YA0783_22925 [Pseudomonas corrugata]|uniref:hypothetical protein n=1 Tax=Pseudomonas corrugata TaxID=47879 RepID=UPI0018E5E63C|nr:hypothetical protein [Pseudomonas corrugata]MBI6621156.1 hypothetical protein [Pseudomonas corrugata]MBI6693722.1 hypothetical protein [Pseudomonas corrugata]
MESVKCDHEWTDDGSFLLACTKCGTQEDHDPKWRDMESAPKDGTLIRLLVSFDEHSTEDEEEAPTIGANNFDNDEEDVWRFAGWCWAHDHFTQGVGTPVGWLPMIDVSPGTADFDRVSAENLALQQRLTVQDQRVDELETQVNSLEQRRQAEQQACQAAERRVEAMCAFANEMVSAAFEGGSLDGADIQDIAVKHGLLRIETRKGECCEGCACREYGFPAECYRRTELIALKPTAEAVSHE